jgi:DNA-directed RNA polymerase subunit RPC12/RpoP
MPKVIYECQFCGKEFEAYASAKRKFCSIECSYKYMSKKHNPKGYPRKPHLSELNRKLNKTRMTDDVKAKLTLSHMGTGEGKSYPKIKGRHIHRVVAEMKLGRPLSSEEVVHHIDGDKNNNDPKNLMVLPSQKEHARLHMIQRLEGEDNEI